MKLKQVVLVAIAAGVLALGGVALQRYDHEPVAQTAATTLVGDIPSAAQSRQALPDFHSIVEQNGPAVVNVSVEGMAQVDDDSLSRSFRRAPQAPVPVHGLGSGFIVSAEGIVLTNAHVVDGASEVTVKLTDRREFRAKVLGSDPVTDIAVLKIDAKNLPTVRLGNPAGLRTGDWVLAIGSPFGFENSVTAGIVSAKGRSLPGDGYVPFIQTDVAVNPGNSGGPLFNMAGEVIGINSQIYSGSGGYQGISFAIPADLAARVEKQIVAHGHATHARLGVAIQGLNAELAGSFGLKTTEGALVSSVVPNSAAARAGLQPGDVILKANGQAIADSGELPALVDRASPGDKLTLEVWRNGAPRELPATLGEAKQVATAGTSSAARAKPDRLGLAVRPLTPEELTAAGIGGGLIVEAATGPAARAGIQPGDIVLALNGVPVKSADALSLALGKSKGVIALLVQRGDAAVYVPIRTG
jgi:serine protease Do